MNKISPNHVKLRYPLFIVILLIFSNSQFIRIESSHISTEIPDQIKVGAIFPITGGLSFGGVPWNQTFHMAINEINSRSDILPDIELIPFVEDSQSSSVEGGNVASNLVTEEVSVIIGASASGISAEVVDVAAPAGIPVVSYASSAAYLMDTSSYPNFLSLTIADTNFGIMMAELIYNVYEVSSVNILATDSPPHSYSHSSFVNAYSDLGGTISATSVFANEATPDFSSHLDVINDTNNHVLFAGPSDTEDIFNQAGQSGISPSSHQWFTSYGALDQETIDLNASPFEGVINLDLIHRNGSLGLHLLDMRDCASNSQYSTAGNRDLLLYDGVVYDTVYTFARAAHEMIFNNVNGGDFINGVKLYDVMKSSSFNGASGLVRFDNDGNRSPLSIIQNVDNGELLNVAIYSTFKGYNQFGNVSLSNGSLSVGSQELDPTQDISGHIPNCKQFQFNGKVRSDYQVGIVYSVGGLSSYSFNQVSYLGTLAALERFDITIDETFPNSQGELDTALDNYASTGYDMVIGVGFGATTMIESIADSYPDVKFVLLDDTVDKPNVASFIFKEHEGSFLVGALAAMVSQTNHISYFAALEIPLFETFGAGFIHGAKFINPTIEVDIAYHPYPGSAFNDALNAETIADALLINGSDIIFSASGLSNLGVFDAISNFNLGGNTTYGIGVDGNQDSYASGEILTSMLKDLGGVLENQIADLIFNEFQAGTYNLGLIDDAVGITDMEFTQAEANEIYSGTMSRIEVVNHLKQLIIDGEIEVASNYSDLSQIDFSDSFITQTDIESGTIIVTETDTITETTIVTEGTETDVATVTVPSDTSTVPNPVTTIEFETTVFVETTLNGDQVTVTVPPENTEPQGDVDVASYPAFISFGVFLIGTRMFNKGHKRKD